MSNDVNASAAMNKGLELLQQNYLKRLSAQAAELRRLQEMLAKGFMPMKDVQQLYRTTHNFSGSGTTFGFPEITRTARALHNTLKKFMDSGEALDNVQILTNERSDVLKSMQAFEQACRDAFAKKSDNIAVQGSAEVAKNNALTDNARSVLILSDESEQAHGMITQLRHFGYDITVAVHRDSIAGSVMPDVAIVYSDLSADDLALVESLASRGSPGVPVIVLSQQDSFESRLSSVRAGASGFFVEAGSDVLKIIEKIEQLCDSVAKQAIYSVLIVDDDEMLAEFYSHALQGAGMKTIVTSNPKDCLDILREQKVDLILLDFAMPYCSGKELATIIRQHPQYIGLPIVFMSALEDIEATLINTGLGIDDFLVKPFTPQQLVSVVASRSRRAGELRSLMVRDSFTGLLNHANFLETLSGALMDVTRHETQTVFAMIDIDYFKKINDTYGHAAGDQVIKSLARMLQQQLRRSDILGRCGGEEFGILMPSCDLENAQRILERLRIVFSEAYYTVGKDKINVTFSGGVVLLKPGDTLNQVINKVDEALYDSKQMGRNRLTTAQ